MKIAFGRPAQGTLAAGTLLLAAVIGAGNAAAAPSGNNGRHVGQEPTAAPSPHGSAARSHNAQAKAHGTGRGTGQAKAQATAQSAQAAVRAAKKSDGPAGTGQGKAHPASGVRGAAADPPGNNGTVKIAALGDLDRIPNNSPHPGCAFEVQWYGFDAGPDVVSTVSFTAQAPTSDVTIAVDGPTSVPVGEDAASGAGTATGLDAVQAYTLSFSGGAPAKQGYHVRLTVATPRSLGNDTKTKVFWVEPCEAVPAAPSATPASIAGPPSPTTDVPSTPMATPASIAGPPPRQDVPSTPMATPAAVVAPPAPDRIGTPPTPGVPTAIDAGEQRNALVRAVSSPWGIGLIAAGALLAALGAVVARRRV